MSLRSRKHPSSVLRAKASFSTAGEVMDAWVRWRERNAYRERQVTALAKMQAKLNGAAVLTMGHLLSAEETMDRMEQRGEHIDDIIGGIVASNGVEPPPE